MCERKVERNEHYLHLFFKYTKAIKTGCDCNKLLRKWPMSFVTEIGGRYLARYHLDRSSIAGGLSIAQS